PLLRDADSQLSCYASDFSRCPKGLNSANYVPRYSSAAEMLIQLAAFDTYVLPRQKALQS
ncbi:MAG: hypothetical protein WAM72_06155, partial [Xanthobacteraceae bacterium]